MFVGSDLLNRICKSKKELVVMISICMLLLYEYGCCVIIIYYNCFTCCLQKKECEVFSKCVRLEDIQKLSKNRL